MLLLPPKIWCGKRSIYLFGHFLQRLPFLYFSQHFLKTQSEHEGKLLL